MKQSSHCYFDIRFTSKNGLRFQIKCVVKMENVFACGRLMACSTSKVYREIESYL